jgi:hypothetical protein
MINKIFKLVANALIAIARFTGLTYNQINILVYYFFIPFTWLVMLDLIFEFHYLKAAYIVFCIGFAFGCRDFKNYSNWAFKRSVDFLNFFNRFGSNYYKSSVWICVAIPIVVYIYLGYLVLKY